MISDGQFPFNENNMTISINGEKNVIFLHCNLKCVNERNNKPEIDNVIKWLIFPRPNTEKCYICGNIFKNHDVCSINIVNFENNIKFFLSHKTCFDLATIEFGNN